MIKFQAPAKLIQKAPQFFFCFLIFQIFFTVAGFCRDAPFNNAANWGGTGLMEIPTARILEDGIMRVVYSQADPYRWYAGAMGAFPGLEFSGRFTELKNVSADKYGAPGYGSYKDKAFDLKYQILAETKQFPALAVGVHDFHGTRLFAAEYMVLSRQIYPFDFTLGIGSKRLKGPVKLPLTDSLGIWGGIEWAVNEQLHLMVEYNPIQYEKGAKPLVEAIPEGAKSQVNVGLRMKIIPGLNLNISWQRGDALGIMGQLQFELGEPISTKRPDPPRWGVVHRDEFNQVDAEQRVKKIQSAIEADGFQGVVVYTDGKELSAEFENNKYISNQKAAGRVLRILLFNSPSDTQKLTAVLRRSQMPFLKVSVKPEHMDKYLMGKMSDDVFSELIEVQTAAEMREQHQRLIKASEKKSFNLQYGVKPELTTFWDYGGGELQIRAGIQPYATAHLWKGGDVHARYDIPFYSNVETTVSDVPNAVRSDSWKYLAHTQPSLDQLIFSQKFRLSKKSFSRFSAGYFEKMYAGVGGELLTFLGDGNLALGIEGDWVRKRDPGAQLALLDFRGHTVLGNMYCYIPGVEITLQAQYGRFLGGDVGWKFTGSREYSSGVVLGAWYSFTDTDVFEDKYNRGYNDKGVFISLPARMFLDYETNTKYYYALRPWGRDVAATVSHWQNLFDMAAELMPADFKSDVRKMKE